MNNKRQLSQQKAGEHLQALLDVQNGLSKSQLKWIEIYYRKMTSDETFSQRDMEVIYDIYDQANDKGLL